MKQRFLLCAAGAAALAASGCAYQGSSYGHGAYPTYSPRPAYQPYGHAQKAYGQTRIELDVSAEQFVDGNLIDANLPQEEVAYKDAFKTGYRVAGGLSRDFRPNTTFTAKGFYGEAEGEDSFVMSNAGGGTTGSVSDYKTYGGELGLRQYLAPNRGRQLRPFVGASVGAAYIEDINLTTGGSTTLLNEGGWQATASAMGGFELPVSPTTSLALESGVRWTGAQDRNAAATGLYGEDNDRFSVPVTLRGRFRF